LPCQVGPAAPTSGSGAGGGEPSAGQQRAPLYTVLVAYGPTIYCSQLPETSKDLANHTAVAVLL
jgi:hypothetical protein